MPSRECLRHPKVAGSSPAPGTMMSDAESSLSGTLPLYPHYAQSSLLWQNIPLIRCRRIERRTAGRTPMVDVQTAMSAARADRGSRKRGKDGEKKGRSGRDHGIEPFDPVKHVSKERADMYSMWLVITFAIVVSLMMRYVVMPNVDPTGSKDLLWFMPMAMIFLLPSLHRMALSESLVEHYGKGTWFRGSFLHIFTWLALTFLLSNPPFADIGDPEVAGAWTVVVVDGQEMILTDSDLDGKNQIEFILDEGEQKIDGEVWLLFGIRDNSDVEVVRLESTLTMPDGTPVSLNTSEERFENLTQWGDSLNASANKLAWPTLISHEFDRGIAIRLTSDGLLEGTHLIELTLTEDGDPWENSRTYEWSLVVSQPTIEVVDES